MPVVSRAPMATRYRDSLAAALGAALAAGLIIALIDTFITQGRQETSGLDLVLAMAGLYAMPTLVAGLAIGVIAGAWRATHGRGSLGRIHGRLTADRELDIAVTGALLSGAAVALILAMTIAVLAMRLVAGVERKGVGALLLGMAVVGLVPALSLLGWPLYRVTRRIARFVPRLGPVPACVGLVILAALGSMALVLYFVFTQLEWRALNLGTYALAGACPLLMLAWALLWYGPLGGLRRRVPYRGVLVALAVMAALALPVLTLRAQPDDKVALAVTEHSLGARVLVKVGRALSDRDHDGFSAFFRGPDCDDHNAYVNPDAREIPDNGLDDNCMGGDRRKAAEPATPDAGSGQNGQAAAPAKVTAQNVLVILIDTVRADRLGVAGYARDGKSLTPRLDDLAKKSSYFTRAYAQAPNTPRSVPSIFASRHPSQLAVAKEFLNFPQVLDENLTIFEVLKEAGIHTVGYASHFYFVDTRNIAQGFDLFDNEGALDIKGSNKDSAAPRIVPKVTAKLAELAQAKRRFAMFVHLFEPHSTYMEHAEFPVTERGVPGLMQKYDYEIAFTDLWIGRILDAVSASGLADSTMIVVLSDHGEAFGVHRVGGQKMFFHGQTLYDELLRVPLIIHVPGVEPGTYSDTAMLVDMAPTVAQAMGVPVPERFVGRSLLGRMQGQPLAPRPAYAEILPAPSWDQSLKAVVSADGKHKLIHHITDRRYELYDLEKDPEERTDISGAETEILARLKDELIRWVEVDLQ